MYNVRYIIMASLAFITLSTTSASYDSRYTSIEPSSCRILSSDEISSTQSCQQFDNIQVKVLEGDIRQSITLTRRGKEYPLEFWRTVSPIFSSLGNKIEWRYTKGMNGKLKGMITRLNASEQSENAKTTSYLVVVSIKKNRMCVVAKIAPQSKQNQKARSILGSVDV